MAEERPWAEIIPFRFRVSLFSDEDGGSVLCRGAFSEVTGLEASMAPKNLKEGGRNWGEVQLSGAVTFPPVILKRGITSLADLWSWFDVTTRQANYALRYTGLIDVYHTDADVQLAFRWRLFNVLPTKFKGPDLSSTASQVAVEELHLVHEGLELERPD